MPVGIQHLHTYFLFAFSIDREAMVLDYPEFWESIRMFSLTRGFVVAGNR